MTFSSPQKIRRDRRFFMSLRDLGFWYRSARADKKLAAFKQGKTVEAAFEDLYREVDDPFGATLEKYRYQHLKYERMLAMLPPIRFGSVLDIGCGLGVLSRMLVGRADHVLGVDVADSALVQARTMLPAAPEIEYRNASVTDLTATIDTKFDLIVLADVLYYLSPLPEETLESIRASVETLLKPDGILLLTHHKFFGFDADSKETERIHDCFRKSTKWALQAEAWRPFYLTSVFAATS